MFAFDFNPTMLGAGTETREPQATTTSLGLNLLSKETHENVEVIGTDIWTPRKANLTLLENKL